MKNRLLCLGTGLWLGSAALTAAQSDLSVAIAQSTPRNFTCMTDGYSAQIRWQGRQPQLTFGRRRSNTSDLNNVPVEELSQRGITTYTTQPGTQAGATQPAESKTIVFVYSDGTCAIAIKTASGETTVNELGYLADQGDTTSLASSPSEETIVLFQTDRNAVRVFTHSGETLMNVYDKQEKKALIDGVPVKIEQTSEETRYTTTQGDTTVEVILNLNGDRRLVINGATEEGY
jgi:hypothetical protein